jgi:hypothetical protein
MVPVTSVPATSAAMLCRTPRAAPPALLAVRLCFAQLDVLLLARVTVRPNGLATRWRGLVRLGSDVRALDLVPLCCKRLLGLRSVCVVVLDRGDHRNALGGGCLAAAWRRRRRRRRRRRAPPLRGRVALVQVAQGLQGDLVHLIVVPSERLFREASRAEEDVNVPRVAPASGSRTVVRSAASAGVVAGAAGSTHAWL